MERRQLPPGIGWFLGGLIGLIFWVTIGALMKQNGAMVGFLVYLVNFVIIGNVIETHTRPLPPHQEQRVQRLVLMGIVLLSTAMVGFLLIYLWS